MWTVWFVLSVLYESPLFCSRAYKVMFVNYDEIQDGGRKRKDSYSVIEIPRR